MMWSLISGTVQEGIAMRLLPPVTYAELTYICVPLASMS